MLFSFDEFPGLTGEDFDTFEPRKWSSNRFNLERMKVRAKLDAMGRQLGRQLADSLEGLSFSTTLDHPHIFNRQQVSSLWVHLEREPRESAQISRVVDKDLSLKEKVADPVPHHHFATTGLAVDHHGVSLFFRLHANALLDRRNLAARLADPAEHQPLIVLFSRLDDSFALRVEDQPQAFPTTAEEVGALRDALDNLAGWFSVERAWTREDPLCASPKLVDAAGELLPQVLALWRFAAWTRQNDRLKLARVLKEERKQKAKRLTGFQEGDRVLVVSGLLSGKVGTVVAVDLKGRVKAQFGRLNIEMEPRLLRKAP